MPLASNQIKCNYNSEHDSINYFNLTLKEALDIYPVMSKDKYGCKSLQNRINDNPSIVKLIVSLNVCILIL